MEKQDITITIEIHCLPEESKVLFIGTAS